jgi:F0F1-type ATP synthase assembly protein I
MIKLKIKFLIIFVVVFLLGCAYDRPYITPLKENLNAIGDGIEVIKDKSDKPVVKSEADKLLFVVDNSKKILSKAEDVDKKYKDVKKENDELKSVENSDKKKAWNGLMNLMKYFVAGSVILAVIGALVCKLALKTGISIVGIAGLIATFSTAMILYGVYIATIGFIVLLICMAIALIIFLKKYLAEQDRVKSDLYNTVEVVKKNPVYNSAVKNTLDNIQSKATKDFVKQKKEQ